MGYTDRAIRVAVAGVLAVLTLFVTSSLVSWVLGGIALILLATSVVGTCPAYLPFGFSTADAVRDTE